VRHPALKVMQGSADDAGSLSAAFAGVDVVASAIGVGGLLQSSKLTTLYSTAATSLVKAMGDTGVRKFWYVSGLVSLLIGLV
jgi:putative NADH-flavin reductase